jgi:hypothetical protein
MPSRLLLNITVNTVKVVIYSSLFVLLFVVSFHEVIEGQLLLLLLLFEIIVVNNIAGCCRTVGPSPTRIWLAPL